MTVGELKVLAGPQDDENEERAMYNGPYKMTGVFRPKIMETLRPCMLPLIGKSFEWDFAGVQDDNWAYPGQTTWTFARKHDPELNNDQKGRWTPAEDIEFDCFALTAIS